MRTTIAVTILLLAASLLGGCAGAGLTGSPLPGTGSLPAFRAHTTDNIGGPPGVAAPQPDARERSQDTFGGLPGNRVHRIHKQDTIGGMPGKVKGGNG
jgi:hypothetical protein